MLVKTSNNNNKKQKMQPQKISYNIKTEFEEYKLS